MNGIRNLLGGLALLLAATAGAQTYPQKPVKLIVPFAAGGITDLVGRVVADYYSRALGQQMVVENRAGAGSKLGAEAVAKAAPDGYTVLFANTVTHGMLATTDPTVSYDTVKDFSPVVAFGSYPVILVTNPALPVRSVAELVAYAKKNPGKLNYSSSGTGAGVHFAGELFKMMTGTEIVHVPYKGSGPALQAVVAGDADLTFDGAAKPFIDSGRVRGLGVLDYRRDPRLPNLPTLDESGVKDCVLVTWQGLAVPAGTPKEVIARLNAVGNAALADRAFAARIVELGLTPLGGTPERMAQMIASDLATYRNIATTAKLQFK